MWCDQNTANEMPNLSDSPAKSKPQSLLSFLHKSKLSSNDETERPTVGISDQHSSGMYFTSFTYFLYYLISIGILKCILNLSVFSLGVVNLNLYYT